MKYDLPEKRTERPLIEFRGTEIAGRGNKAKFNEVKRRGLEIRS